MYKTNGELRVHDIIACQFAHMICNQYQYFMKFCETLKFHNFYFSSEFDKTLTVLHLLKSSGLVR